MFCNRCGAPVEPDFNLCPKCGTPLSSSAPVLLAPTKLERHLRVLAILWIAIGALWLVPSLVLMVFSHASRLVVGDEMFARPFMPPLLFSLGSAFLVVAAGGVLVGWGLMRHEGWARTTAIIVGILALIHFPFGTALGVYTLWVLLPGDAAREYARLSRV